MLPVLATMSNEMSSFRQSRNKLNMFNLFQRSTLSKKTNFTINWFDIVAIFGNKIECCFDKVKRCFDIVAGGGVA